VNKLAPHIGQSCLCEILFYHAMCCYCVGRVGTAAAGS